MDFICILVTLWSSQWAFCLHDISSLFAHVSCKCGFHVNSLVFIEISKTNFHRPQFHVAMLPLTGLLVVSNIEARLISVVGRVNWADDAVDTIEMQSIHEVKVNLSSLNGNGSANFNSSSYGRRYYPFANQTRTAVVLVLHSTRAAQFNWDTTT